MMRQIAGSFAQYDIVTKLRGARERGAETGKATKKGRCRLHGGASGSDHHSDLRIGARRLCRRLVRFIVPLFRVGKPGAIEVEHEKPNGR